MKNKSSWATPFFCLVLNFDCYTVIFTQKLTNGCNHFHPNTNGGRCTAYISDDNERYTFNPHTPTGCDPAFP